ncbi:MAG: phosphoribosyltransferase family protein [bacterium]|nr:phosphoribosyltransferase family protein [bacterium]
MKKPEFTIHILWGGRPHCGFSPEVPGNWPADHRWVGPEEADKANCHGCVTKEILHHRQAVITGSHVVYKSGKHGEAYINKDALYLSPRDTSRICQMIAEEFADEGIEVVVGPAVGGVALSQWLAHHLSELTGREIAAVFADKEGEGFAIKRGYGAAVKDKKVLVIEDILTTGGSASETAKAVRESGGEVVAIAAICNRGNVTAENLGVPKLVSLIDVQLDMWDEDQCLLCRDRVPINTEVGHGAKFLASR